MTTSVIKTAIRSSIGKMKDEQDDGNEEVPQNLCLTVNQNNVNKASTKSIDLSWTSNKVAEPLPDSRACEEYNWQAKQDTVRQRNAVMFNNPLMADVYFVVGKKPNTQRIPAHKYILATGSSVFMAMLYGGLAGTANNDICIPDVEPYAFLNLLRYLYYDDIQLSADTVLATLYVAKKYLVPNLANACVVFLQTSLTAANASLLLSQARLFEERDLVQRCWEVIDAQCEEALRADVFTDIDYPTLVSVLGRETLNARELSIFEATQRWAEAECGRRDIEPTPTNARHVLGPALYMLRVPAMTLDEFANGPAQSSLLTIKEINDVFLYYTADNKPDLQFSACERHGLLPQFVHRFQSSAYRSNQWRYRGRCDSIQFSVDKRLFVAGFGLYGSSNGMADYQVRIELKRNGAVLGKDVSKFVSDGSSRTFSVYFNTPIQIEPDTYYTASAMLEGTELSYFGQEGMAEVQSGQVVFQFQCSSDSTNGTGVQGGQIPEIIFYA